MTKREHGMDEHERKVKITEIEIHDDPATENKNFEERANPTHYSKLKEYGEDGTFKNYLEEYAGERILDIACGYAQWTDLLLSDDNDVEYHGVDVSKTRVTSAAQRTTDINTSFTFADAENLPFKNSSFDTIISSSALHHLPNWDEKGLDEIQRVLRSGGNLVFREPLKYNPLVAIYRRFFPMETHTPYEQPFDPRQLKGELEERFEEVNWQGHYLVVPTIPFIDGVLPITIPTKVSKNIYDIERRIIDKTTVFFCHQVTGVAKNCQTI